MKAQSYRRVLQDTPPIDEREARHNLVAEHAPMLRKLARRILRRLPSSAAQVEEDDLVSAGIIGLIEADARYEPTAGRTFAQYAEFRVRGAMLDELRGRDLMPRRLRARANKLRKAERELETSLSREPTEEEVAAALELSVPRLRKLRSDVQPYQMIDADDSEVVQLRSDAPNAFALLAARQDRERLATALQSLPERQALILDLYFHRELTLREIGDVLELTVGRISQLKTQAIATLRARLSE